MSLVISYFIFLKVLYMEAYFKFLRALEQIWSLPYPNLQENMVQNYQYHVHYGNVKVSSVNKCK